MSREWTLSYASHVGYLSPDEPLFRHSAASSDIRDHVAFAAEQGFAGVLYPWAVARPSAEVDRFEAALTEFDLRCGCIVFGPFEAVETPVWTQRERATQLQEYLNRSVPLAERLGSSTLAVLLKADGSAPREAQEKIAIDRLRHAADSVAKAGMIIGIEPMIDLPGMLLATTAQAVEFLERVAHPAVRMIFDTGHVAAMDNDVMAAYRLARDQIGLIQLADMPGRVGPGSGTIDFVSLLREAARDGHADRMIELEHGWGEASIEAERAGIEALRLIDAQLAQKGTRA